jgi:hypothetical protein
MHSSRIALLLAVGLLGSVLAAPGQAAEGHLPEGGKPQLMPSSEVTAGMKGQGLSSFSSYGVQSFDFEVLGKMAGWWPRADLILIRMSGPVVDDAGIISGMSGSPCYIDGKLIGAVAYGWGLCKIPLAGVTPAEQMMQVDRIEEAGQASGGGRPMDADRRLEARRHHQARMARMAEFMSAKPTSWDAMRPLRQAALHLGAPRPLWTTGRSLDRQALPASVRSLLPAEASRDLTPLPIPLSLNTRAFPGLAPLVRGTGFTPVQAGGAGPARAGDEVVAVPGISVGCAFVTGDMDISGMGTLTWTDGETALAFGHPMFGSGATDLPLVLGDVQTIVPSLDNSFKLASAGRVVGRITQDRETAILARLGEEAPTFPCTVSVRGTVDNDHSYRIVGYWELAPMFTFYALYYSSSLWEGSGNRYTLTARSSIRMKGLDEPFEFENVYNSYSVLDPSMDLVEYPMDSLLLNPYQELEVESVDYELEVRPGFSAALIESAWADRARVKPGDEVTVYVRLLQYRGERTTRELKLRIPETALPGAEVQILLCDAMTNRMIRRSLDPGFFAPRSFDDFAEAIREMEPNTNLFMRASVADQGVRYDGAAMPSLPPSALSILQHNKDGGQSTQLVTDVVDSVETPWVIEGAQTVLLTVERPDYGD